ncbi:unnamed protein product [Lactuca virosa]|uniref:Uncharacterized protein n=1 Tax=Lactuca virosa TaxID=75947 RepID=A0AAU9NRJ8_9ASTR|nr:unnamed protein product [Lactuca virosa]
MEKVVAEENVVGPKPVVILQESEHLNVEFDKGDVGRTPRFLRFGYVESPMVGVGEVRNSSGAVFAPSCVVFAKKKELEENVASLELGKLALGVVVGQLKQETKA